jgi:hypothetical protein
MTIADWTLPVQLAIVLGVGWCVAPSLLALAARLGAGRTRLGYRRPRNRRPIYRWLHPELESAVLALLVGVALLLVASMVMP